MGRTVPKHDQYQSPERPPTMVFSAAPGTGSYGDAPSAEAFETARRRDSLEEATPSWVLASGQQARQDRLEASGTRGRRPVPRAVPPSHGDRDSYISPEALAAADHLNRTPTQASLSYAASPPGSSDAYAFSVSALAHLDLDRTPTQVYSGPPAQDGPGSGFGNEPVAGSGFGQQYFTQSPSAGSRSSTPDRERLRAPALGIFHASDLEAVRRRPASGSPSTSVVGPEGQSLLRRQQGGARGGRGSAGEGTSAAYERHGSSNSRHGDPSRGRRRGSGSGGR